MFLTNTMYSQSAHADPTTFTVSVMHNGSKTMPDTNICISGGGQCVNAKAADIDFLIKALNAVKEDLQRFPPLQSETRALPTTTRLPTYTVNGLAVYKHGKHFGAIQHKNQHGNYLVRTLADGYVGGMLEEVSFSIEDSISIDKLLGTPEEKIPAIKYKKTESDWDNA